MFLETFIHFLINFVQWFSFYSMYYKDFSVFGQNTHFLYKRIEWACSKSLEKSENFLDISITFNFPKKLSFLKNGTVSPWKILRVPVYCFLLWAMNTRKAIIRKHFVNSTSFRTLYSPYSQTKPQNILYLFFPTFNVLSLQVDRLHLFHPSHSQPTSTCSRSVLIEVPRANSLASRARIKTIKQIRDAFLKNDSESQFSSKLLALSRL